MNRIKAIVALITFGALFAFLKVDFKTQPKLPEAGMPLDQEPFVELASPRSVGIHGLPEEIATFYARNEGIGLESSPDFIVRLCKLDEIKPITWKELHIFGADDPPEGWKNFAGYRIGISSFFDEIIYVASAPVCPPGSILTTGPDISGPGGTGRHTLEYSLVLASSFDLWIAHLSKSKWIEYGIVPGGVNDLPVAKQQAMTAYYKALNPGINWE